MALTKEYLMALKSLEGIGPAKLLKIGHHIEDNNLDIISADSLVPILQTLKIKVNKEPVTIDQINMALKQARYEIDKHAKAGIGITTYYDDDFPSVLRKTINEEGKYAPPMVLYYKGDLSITKKPCLAIVGTREITDFGKAAGMILSKRFAEKGFCIVSGLAIGCDTIGHKGALEVGGKTVAFLAHGLDTIYPPENKQLAQDIIDRGGLLMSEYPIGTGVNKYNLVARDRLQAGLSMATLVIQTGEHGGTMHAANTTLKAQKPLYTIMFKDIRQNEHEKSLGNALLVKKGAKYISGRDNIDVISREILEYKKPQNSLFE